MPCWSNVLTVLGGVAEIFGLALVITEIVKVQRREIPEHRGWVVRSLAATRRAGEAIAHQVRRLLRRGPEPQDATVHVAAMRGSATGGGSASGTITVGPPPTLAERVERLEAEIRRLDEQAAADRQAMRTEAQNAKTRAERVDREIRAMIDERDRQRREGVRDSLSLQWIGTVLFIVGVGLSVWGNLVSC